MAFKSSDPIIQHEQVEYQRGLADGRRIGIEEFREEFSALLEESGGDLAKLQELVDQALRPTKTIFETAHEMSTKMWGDE